MANISWLRSRILVDFARPVHKIPVPLHPVEIDHVRALETIVQAISDPTES